MVQTGRGAKALDAIWEQKGDDIDSLPGDVWQTIFSAWMTECHYFNGGSRLVYGQIITPCQAINLEYNSLKIKRKPHEGEI